MIKRELAIPGCDEFLDRVQQVRISCEAASPNCFAGQIAKPAFDHSKPDGRDRNGVPLESRISHQLAFLPWSLTSIVAYRVTSGRRSKYGEKERVRIECRNLSLLQQPTALHGLESVIRPPDTARVAEAAEIEDWGIPSRGSPLMPRNLAISIGNLRDGSAHQKWNSVCGTRESDLQKRTHPHRNQPPPRAVRGCGQNTKSYCMHDRVDLLAGIVQPVTPQKGKH